MKSTMTKSWYAYYCPHCEGLWSYRKYCPAKECQDKKKKVMKVRVKLEPV